MCKREDIMTSDPAVPPLQGIRVLDFTTMLAGPYASRLLADLGAEVIKVEPPDGGDHNRARRPIRNGFSTLFGHLNAGKRSVMADLKDVRARAAILCLAKRCDIVIENWRPGVADRLGVGYADIAAIKPDIIFCSISGYGQKGPSALKAAYAPIIHATSGYDLMQLKYLEAEDHAPVTGTYIADVVGGLSAFAAIQTALYQRERSGFGRYIDVSLLDGVLNLMVFECQAVQFPGQEPRVHRAVPAADGYIILTPTSQKNFEAMARAIGHPEWITDDRFARTESRERNWRTMMSLISQWTAEKPASTCEEILSTAGVPCAVYRTLGEALADPQVEERSTMAIVTDGAGAFRVPNPPFKLAGAPVRVGSSVATLGQHTDEYLNSQS
jgi:crotonobetainyl-CoA:carnitine CoA-transferase CaiB-like acyl-CoA transferase